MTGLLVNLLGIGGAAEPRAGAEAARRGMAGEPSAPFATALSTALAPQRMRGTKETAAPTAERESEQADDAGSTSAAEIAGTRYGGTAAAGTRSASGPVGQDADAAGVDAPVTGLAGAAVGAPAAQPVTAETDEDASLSAGTLATSDATPSAAMDPTPPRVNRALGGLLPEFRARLERVIDRMESEFGHEVTVVETVRGQARQEQLYAQGRTSPGPVVTWTRASNHTVGRAADLMVDGSYENPLAMVRLARIAREEGLRTLGGRDPGHVELPQGVSVDRLVVGADGSTSLLDNLPGASGYASFAHRDGVARVAAVVSPAAVARVADAAPVAQVAMPARLAQAASVARVAQPGRGGVTQWRSVPDGESAPLQLAVNGRIGTEGSERDASLLAAHARESEPSAAAMASRSAGPEGSPLREGGRREGRSSNREPMTEASGDALPRVATASPPGSDVRAIQLPREGAMVASGVFGAEAVERIARVLQLQDAAPARPLSQVVLRVDNAVGGEDRIRVDLRGSAVGASLELGDPVAAARMHSELGQLQRALEGKGLRAEHLSVLGGLAGREAEALRTLLPPDQGQRSMPDQGSRRDGGNDGSRNGSDAGFEERRRRSHGDSQQGRQT